jgi:hypothetical protein
VVAERLEVALNTGDQVAHGDTARCDLPPVAQLKTYTRVVEPSTTKRGPFRKVKTTMSQLGGALGQEWTPVSRADRDDSTILGGEISRLTAENERLRDLLGLDDRRSDGHKVAWSPSLLSQTRPLPSVDGSSPNEDKLALFKSLFGARTDVYATHWESASTGKAGWSPATRGRWSRQRAHQD